MVGRLGGEARYLVGSIINGVGEERGTAGYKQIVDLNAALAAKYKDRFVDLRAALIGASGNPASDVPSEKLRFDFLHLNDAGYKVVADSWAAAIDKQGWLAGR